MTAERAIERIHVGDQMTQLAVGVDEIGHRRRRPRGRARAGSSGKREVIAREDERPTLVHGARVLPVPAVQGLDVLRIRAREGVERVHDVRSLVL